MTTTKNEAVKLIEKFYAVADANPFNEEGVAEFFAEDFTNHNRHDDEALSDREFSIVFYGQLAQGFPDAKHNFEMLEPIGTDKAMVYWEFNGTNSGSFLGTPCNR